MFQANDDALPHIVKVRSCDKLGERGYDRKTELIFNYSGYDINGDLWTWVEREVLEDTTGKFLSREEYGYTNHGRPRT